LYLLRAYEYEYADPKNKAPDAPRVYGDSDPPDAKAFPIRLNPPDPNILVIPNRVRSVKDKVLDRVLFLLCKN
jgi:hypothetical protein